MPLNPHCIGLPIFILSKGMLHSSIWILRTLMHVMHFHMQPVFCSTRNFSDLWCITFSLLHLSQDIIYLVLHQGVRVLAVLGMLVQQVLLLMPHCWVSEWAITMLQQERRLLCLFFQRAHFGQMFLWRTMLEFWFHCFGPECRSLKLDVLASFYCNMIYALTFSSISVNIMNCVNFPCLTDPYFIPLSVFWFLTNEMCWIFEVAKSDCKLLRASIMFHVDHWTRIIFNEV